MSRGAVSLAIHAFVVCICCVSAVLGGEQELRFDPPREVTIHRKTGSTTLGKLLSFSLRQVVVEVAGEGRRPEEKLSIPLNEIRSFTTADAEFQFSPTTIPEDLMGRGRMLEGVSVAAVVAAPSVVTPKVPPPSQLEDGEDAPQTEENSPSNSGGPATPGSAPKMENSGPKVLVTCSNCRKEVTVSESSQVRCPHCGVLWIEDSVAPVTIGGPSPDLRMPSGHPHAGPAVGAADSGGVRVLPQFGGPPQPVGQPMPAQQQAAQPQPGQGVQRLEVPPVPAPDLGPQEEMNLANIPVWVKLTLFLGVSFVGYFLLFRRS
ncbi:hypothetical protein [Planctomicrobium sp. SH664]|uniref:hypothetical protein n=1 Tax=Planctomicrobium sp. SH664 TaxID=3448125 RepID=UPI003F5B7454